MEFEVGKKDLTSALKQILSGQNEGSKTAVKLALDKEELRFVLPGKSVAIGANATTRGIASVPIGVIFGLKRMCENSEDEQFKVAVKNGCLRIQKATISHSDIALVKKKTREVVIPDDAGPMDILALRYVLSSDEIDGNGLYSRLQEAQTEWKRSLDNACEALRPYGFTLNELALLSKTKLKEHAEKLKPLL
jgi:hypothetical protein